MSLIIFVFLIGAALVGVGIFQMKTYYSDQHYQEVRITGYARCESSAHGLSGFAIDALSDAAGLRGPVVDITNDDGSVESVRLNVTVHDRIIAQYPEFDIDGTVNITYFGKHPKTVYLTDHPMAQTVMKVSLPLLGGIASLVLAVVLAVVYILAPSN